MPSCRHHHGHSRWLGHVHKLRPGFLSGTNAAFIGSGSASQRVYQCHPGDPCRLVADTGTAIPSGGLFTGFDQPWVSGTTTAFLGFGSSGTTGVYVCHPSDACQPAATRAPQFLPAVARSTRSPPWRWMVPAPLLLLATARSP